MKATGNFENARNVDPMVVLTDKTRAHIDHWLAKFPPERKRSAVIQGLHAAQELVAHAEQKLGCKLGESTADGRVYLKREEECLAACCGAPVVVINGHYHEKLDPAKVDELLDGLK